MSEGDREQREAMIDAYYRLAKDNITESRKISPQKFDDLIDNSTIFLAEDALAAGLVDSLGRWDDIKQTINESNKKLIQPSTLSKFRLPNDNRWGKKPAIALIYGSEFVLWMKG